MIKITKLDRRYNGYTVFKYIVEIDIRAGAKDERTAKFKELREWMWEHYGPGCELDYVMLDFKSPKDSDGLLNSRERWAWQTAHGEQRLYIKPEQFTFMKLKWV